MALSPRLTGAALGFFAFGAYSAYDISAKLLGAAYHPFQIVAAAGLMLCPLLLGLVLLDREPGPLRPARPGLMALRSLATVVNFLCGVTSFTLLPLAEAYVIFFTMPLMIAVLAVPLLAERIDPVRGLAVLAGLGGVVLALDPQATPLGWGHALAATGAACGALNALIIRMTGQDERTATLVIWPMLGLFLVVAATMPFVYRPMALADLGLAGGMAVAQMAGLMALVAAYRRAPALVVAPMQYSQILWAGLLGGLLFGDRMSGRTLAGVAVIALAGLLIVARQDRPPPASAPPPASDLPPGAG